MSQSPTRRPAPDADARRPLSELSVFTTGEAASATGLSQQTIIRNFDAGRLQGYRVPGSRFRRIPRESLLAFLHDNNIPQDRLHAPRGGGHRLLVVDDDPGVLSLLDEVLRRDGRFEVRTASSGYDAGVESVSFKPALMLLDYMLPDINGDRVCRSVRQNPELADTRVLIISGAATDEEVQRLLDAGADGYLKKPFELKALLGAIETHLKIRSAG